MATPSKLPSVHMRAIPMIASASRQHSKHCSLYRIERRASTCGSYPREFRPSTESWRIVSTIDPTVPLYHSRLFMSYIVAERLALEDALRHSICQMTEAFKRDRKSV